MDRAHHMMLWELSLTLLLFGDQEVGCMEWTEMCVLSQWLTLLCAFWHTLTGWEGPVLCKSMVWRQRKCWDYLKQILQSQQKLFDSISEGTEKLPSYLIPIFCRFNYNNDDIIIVMQHACRRAWSIYSNGSEKGSKERLVCISFIET